MKPTKEEVSKVRDSLVARVNSAETFDHDHGVISTKVGEHTKKECYFEAGLKAIGKAREVYGTSPYVRDHIRVTFIKEDDGIIYSLAYSVRIKR